MTPQELLAILLGTGDTQHDALAVAAQLLAPAHGALRRLAARPPAELQRTPGVGPAKAARLLAAFELGVRLAQEGRPALERIVEPCDVARLVGPRLRDLEVEEFHLLALDTRSRVLRDILVTRGLLDSSLYTPGKSSGRRSPRRLPVSFWCTTIRAGTPPPRRKIAPSLGSWWPPDNCWMCRSTIT